MNSLLFFFTKWVHSIKQSWRQRTNTLRRLGSKSASRRTAVTVHGDTWGPAVYQRTVTLWRTQHSSEVRVYTKRQVVNHCSYSTATSQMGLVCSQRGTDKERTLLYRKRQKHLKIIDTIPDVFQRLVFYLKRKVSETAFWLISVEPTQLSPIDTVNLCLLPAALGLGVYWAANRNEYQKQNNNFLGSRARPVRRDDNLTAICEPNV
jgi:hypothetical protein